MSQDRYRAAHLSADELHALQDLERRLGVILVAYEPAEPAGADGPGAPASSREAVPSPEPMPSTRL